MITTFSRHKINNNKIYGFIVKESDKFILIKIVNDFSFDGFQILRKKDITNQVISDSNKYCVNIMKMEGVWNIRCPQWIKNLDLASWHSVFNGINSKIITIENEIEPGSFYIGPIMEILKYQVGIKYFNSVGEWGDIDRMQFKLITTCKFLDRYSTIHSKYLKNLPNKAMQWTS